MKAVEDGLGRLEGVAELHTDLQQNVVEITPARDVAPDLARIPAVVAESGFRAGRMWIAARGRAASVAGGGEGFRIDGWSGAIPVEGGAVADGPLEAEVLCDGRVLRLRPGEPR